jgi:hypothetical protein
VVMCVFRYEILRDQRGGFRPNGSAAVIFGILLLLISSLLSPEIAFTTTIYSYIDDRGTPVLTDNFENIPERYRAKVQVTEQAPKAPSDHSVAARLQQKIAGWAGNTGTGLSAFIPNISGLTHYQSQILSYGAAAAVICLLVRLFVRSQAVRFLSLWCLIMLGLTVPALLFTSQDAPLDLFRDQAGKIQVKQQEHLQRVP